MQFREVTMKKWLSVLVATAVLSTSAAANTQDYKLVTVAGYLNFYLLNLNACEDFHPQIRTAAYDTEKQLYPYLDKLYQKLGGAEGQSQKMIAGIVSKRRDMLNSQIAEGDFTLEHCQAIVKILQQDGLDKTLLASLD